MLFDAEKKDRKVKTEKYEGGGKVRHGKQMGTEKTAGRLVAPLRGFHVPRTRCLGKARKGVPTYLAFKRADSRRYPNSRLRAGVMSAGKPKLLWGSGTEPKLINR